MPTPIAAADHARAFHTARELIRTLGADPTVSLATLGRARDLVQTVANRSDAGLIQEALDELHSLATPPERR